MPDHPPTPTPQPMSEDELKDYERIAFRDCEAGSISMSHREAVDALVAEVRRLQAKKKDAWKAAGDEMIWRMAVENDRDAKAKELRAVRAAVEEESKRADRAEAAARELRAKANEEIRWTKYDFDEKCTCLMCRTAWLTGGNES